MINRQLRNWVFMLYPDNPNHEKAIEYLDLLDNSLYIKHVEKLNDDGSIKNKEHYHCVMKFENGYWLSTLLNDLGLKEDDSHLFHSYKDFKSKGKQRFKTLDDYIDYLDHVNENKEDKYSIDDFHGGLKSLAQKIIAKRENNGYENFYEMCLFIRDYNLKHFNDTRLFTFTDWLGVCIENGYGSLFFINWYKMRDILKPYINLY